MARPPWSEWTLVHLVRGQAARHGDRPFVRFEDGQGFTFRELHDETDALAGSLAALGVRAGDRVLSLIGNRAEAMGLLFATVKLGEIFAEGMKGKELGTRTNEFGTTVTRLVERDGVRLHIGYFYKNGDLTAAPTVSTVIPKVLR